VAETGLRAGEIAGLKLTDIDGERLTVNQSVWGGKEQAPKTDNSIRSLALSPQLISLLRE
jgi:integrase